MELCNSDLPTCTEEFIVDMSWPLHLLTCCVVLKPLGLASVSNQNCELGYSLQTTSVYILHLMTHL
jgi:hypothetical protein